MKNKEPNNRGQSWKQNFKPCKPGETHNPNGRPKKIDCMSDIAREILASKSINMTIKLPNGREKIIKLDGDKTFRHAMVAAQVIEALKGSTAAFKELSERADGKIPVKIDGINQQPVTIVVQENIIGKLPEANERPAIDTTSADQPVSGTV